MNAVPSNRNKEKYKRFPDFEVLRSAIRDRKACPERNRSPCLARQRQKENPCRKGSRWCSIRVSGKSNRSRELNLMTTAKTLGAGRMNRFLLPLIAICLLTGCTMLSVRRSRTILTGLILPLRAQILQAARCAFFSFTEWVITPPAIPRRPLEPEQYWTVAQDNHSQRES